MVREIIHIQVGQCGNQIGNAFWNTMSGEHHLAPDGKFTGSPENPADKLRLDKIDVYYKEAVAAFVVFDVTRYFLFIL